MKYDYNIETIAHNSIEIEKPENCCLKCTYVDGTYSYLVIVSALGFTEVITYDKMNKSSQNIPAKVTYQYQRFETNLNRVDSTIDKFINSADSVIISTTTLEIVKQDIINMIDVIGECNNE